MTVNVDVSDAVRAMQASGEAVAAATRRALPDMGRFGVHREQQVIMLKRSRRIGNVNRVRHSRLARAVKVLEVTDTSVTFGPDLNEAPHALHANYPTRPHDIFPRNKKALLFASSGGNIVYRKRGGRMRPFTQLGSQLGLPVFARKVRHPGTPGLHYHEDTIADLQASGDLERIYTAHLEAELGRVSRARVRATVRDVREGGGS